jgi:hypothetical protein
MYDGARDPNAPFDLYEPVPGHQGAHGAFDSRARESSSELVLTTRVPWGAVAAAGVTGLAGLLLAAARRR